MSVIKCPTDCEHDYYFPHSVITHSRRLTLPGNIKVIEATTFITCRLCKHWISGKYACPCSCHGETGGYECVRSPVDAVD
jgi:hypothetical protein